MRDDDKVKIYTIFRLWLKVNQHCIDASNAKEVLICLKHLDCFRYLKHLLIFFRFQLILIVIVCDKSFSQIATSPWKCGWAHQSECMEVGTLIVFKSFIHAIIWMGKFIQWFTNALSCRWFFNLVGDSRCPISDTWWQTETGGFMVDSLLFRSLCLLIPLAYCLMCIKLHGR